LPNEFSKLKENFESTVKKMGAELHNKTKYIRRVINLEDDDDDRKFNFHRIKKFMKENKEYLPPFLIGFLPWLIQIRHWPKGLLIIAVFAATTWFLEKYRNMRVVSIKLSQLLAQIKQLIRQKTYKVLIPFILGIVLGKVFLSKIAI